MKTIREYLITLKLLKPLFLAILFIAFCIALITAIIIRTYPAWLKSNWLLLLLPAVLIIVLPLIGVLHQLFSPLVVSIRRLQKRKRAFTRVTQASERILKPRLVGIPKLIQRAETGQIIDLLLNGSSILLTGEAGTGKSGIATSLMQDANTRSIFPILIDARRIAEIQDPQGLRSFFDIEESIIDCISEIAETTSVIVIVDQIDNVAGSPSCGILTDFLIDCSNVNNIYAVAISRQKESNEQNALRPLLDAGFTLFVCPRIDDDLATDILKQVGFVDIPNSLKELGQNLLNLDLLCSIAQASNIDDLSTITDEFSLWEKYRVTLVASEKSPGFTGDTLIAEAVRLAKLGLQAVDRGFEIPYPPSAAQLRLSSSNIIELVSGRKYQFTHEKMQDYLYAWDACEQGLSLFQVDQEIGSLHARNIIVWMRDIYHAIKHPQYEVFLEEVFSG